MRAKLVVALVAVAMVVVLGATSARADDIAQPAAYASSCVGCCESAAVCEALAGLADLRDTVGGVVQQAGTANSLDAKLDAATRSVLDLNITAALNQLDAFGHEVDALEASGRSSAAVSNIMKTKHDTVKNSISNIR